MQAQQAQVIQFPAIPAHDRADDTLRHSERESFLAQLAAVDDAALQSVVCKCCNGEPVTHQHGWEGEQGEMHWAYRTSCACTDGPVSDDEMDALASWAELTDSDADWCPRADLVLADGTGRVLRTATHEEVEAFVNNDRMPIEVAGVECVIRWMED